MDRRWFGTLLLASALVLGAAEPPAKATLEYSKAVPVVDSVGEDQAVAKVIAPLALELRSSFGRELVRCPSGLFRGRPAEENLLGYWVADLMRSKAAQVLGVPVKVGFTNSGGLRANLRPGILKVGDIYEVMPFENELVVAEYTGAEVVQMVKDGLLRRAGEPISGVKAKVMGTPEKPEITVTWSDGSSIAPDEVVKVALTDYLLTSGDGMSAVRQGRRPITVGIPLRDLLLDECARLGRLKFPLLAPAGGRYEFSPEVAQAIRDRRKLSW